jgi:glutaconate CoA-transferase subunit B
MSDKVMSAAQAAGMIRSGMHVAVGAGMDMNPMPVIREIIRNEIRDLTLTSVLTGGYVADLLIGAGCVSTVQFPQIVMDEFGLAPSFSRAAKAGKLKMIESICPALLLGLQAGANGIPFTPVIGLLNSDYMKIRPDVRVMKDPYTGNEYAVVPPIVPDVAVIHAFMGDRTGAVITDGFRRGNLVYVLRGKIRPRAGEPRTIPGPGWIGRCQMTNAEIHPFETMIVVISRLVKNGEMAATGTLSPIPAASLLLAKHTHAPDLVSMIYGDPEMRITDGLHEFFGLAHRGLLDLFFLSGIQIDRQGNINLSVIGDYEKPKVRLPGGAGTNMLSMMAKRIIIFTIVHNTRLFVPKVDFINARAADESIPWRRGTLSYVVTPMARLKFDEQHKVIVLDATHPGHSVTDICANTGFDLGVEGRDIPEIDPITSDELSILRGDVVRKLRGIYPLFCDMIWGTV